MVIGYCRISTKSQSMDLQLDALKAAGCETIFSDVSSGAKSARPGLDKMLSHVRSGDTVVVYKLDRLGRSLQHLVWLMNRFSEMNVGMRSIYDPIDTTSAQGRLVANIFAVMAEFERELIVERTKSGLEAARARGRKGGRPKGLSATANAKAIAAAVMYTDRESTKSVNEIADELSISKTTLYKYLRIKGVLKNEKP